MHVENENADYYESLVHAEVPGGLLKTILKRGCWSGTLVVGCFGRGGSGGKEVGEREKGG